MANGVQLATAYISLNVRTDNIKKQVEGALKGAGSSSRQLGSSMGSDMLSGMRDKMRSGNITGVFAPIGVAGLRWAGTAGKAIGSALRTAIVSGISAGIGAAIFGAGAVLAAGLNRLRTLQMADVQLSLKLSPEEIKRVKKEITEVVTGTPVALDEAMRAVPRAINAGLRGSELKQYIQDIADLTASTGGQGGFDQLAVILEKVRANGKLAGGEMEQLVDAGVDVRGILKDTFGWDDKTLQKNLEKGKVGINEIQKAIQNSFGKDGGLAKKYGETFDGAVRNVKAATARLGANFISALMGKESDEDPLKDIALGIGNVTQGLNNMSEWVDENRDEIRGAFTTIRDVVGTIGEALSKLPGYFEGFKRTATSVANWFSRTWDNATSAMTRVKTGVNELVQNFKKKFTEVVDDVKEVFDDWFGEDSFFGKLFKRVEEAINKLRGALGIGPATANADAPEGQTNRGPMKPGGSAPTGGREPGWGGPTGVPGADGRISMNVPGAGGVRGKFGGIGDLSNLKEPTPRKVGSDKGLLQGTIELKDYLTTSFPEITDVGGYRDTDYTPWGVINEHASGKAFDIMVPQEYMDPKTGRPTAEGLAWGDRVMKEALAKGASVLWKQTQYDPDGNVAGMPDRGDNTQNHWDHLHILEGSYANYAAGGKVMGAGNGTSDSIPAMLSNGEHVLTAADVKKMGGQGAVYAFRQALQAGVIPGFNMGGPVDPSVITDTQNQLADLNNQLAVDKARFDEVMANEDATDSDKVAARRALERSQRLLTQMQQDAPIIMGGGTPPDRGPQNRVFDATDALDAQNRALQELTQRDDVPDSQMIQAQYGVAQAQRERDQAIAELTGTGQQTDYGAEFVRSLGFIPAAAGNTGVAGTSSLANFIGMGNDIVGGLIDTGTNLAQQAVSAAIAAGAAAGSFGAAAPAAPLGQMAASYGIQLLGNQAKRISSYWFQMAGIGADALMEQISPFGMPRWLGYDYGNFMPQIGIQEAALSTLEQMGGDAIKKYFAGQGTAPVIPPDPTAGTNTAPSGPSASGSFSMQLPGPAQMNTSVGAGNSIGNTGTIEFDPFGIRNPLGAGGAGGGGSWAKGGHVGIYDNGGVLNPGELAFNASRTPESILTKQQWNAMAANAATKPKDSPLVQNLYAQDMQDAIRQLEKVKRRDMMQYAGRP